MFIEKIKHEIKSTPFLHQRLLPMVRCFRQRRQLKSRPRPERKLWHFLKLCRELPRVIPNPVFVKIGANDGVTGDPCSDLLLKDPRWKGLLIEPVPYCFDRLKKNFSDTERFTLEQVAVGAEAGTLPFYYVAENARSHLPNLPDWYDQLGSFDRNHITKHLDGALEPFVIECTVEVNTLHTLLDRNGIENIHLLHIDTEGHDYEILKTVDFSHCPPLLILVEHDHLCEKEKNTMRRLLQKNHYTVHNCGMDFSAIHKPSAQRLGLYL